MLTTLQLHGLYLMAVGKLMLDENRSAMIITGGNFEDKLVDLMVRASKEKITADIARAHVQRIDTNIATNAQF